MDPDVLLAQIRELCSKIAHEPSELSEKVEQLDAWISKGGFLPKMWRGCIWKEVDDAGRA